MSTSETAAKFTTIPEAVKEQKPGQLTETQLKHFFEEGFLVVKNLLTPDELQPCRDDTEQQVDKLVEKLHKAGKLNDKHEDLGLFERLTAVCKDCPGANVLLYRQQTLCKAYRDLLSNRKLLNVCEQIIGPEIAAHPVWNLRAKIPSDEATLVPWHQDTAYFASDAADHMILTAWIPFLDTDGRNGGMQVLRRTHRKGEVGRHTCCWGSTFYLTIDEDEIERSLGADMDSDIVTCEVPYGGVLLFSNLLVHRSVPNLSSDIRWSIDIRYQSPRETWGYYDIVEGVVLQDEDGRVEKPNWDPLLNVHRRTKWLKDYAKLVEIPEMDEFDLIVVGPWLGRWDITNENGHTQAYKQLMEHAQNI